MNQISVSVMCMDLLNLQDHLSKLDEAGADLYHIDIMDGQYVPNFALNVDVMKAIRKVSRTPMDVHLMVSNPDEYIETFAKAGADIIIPHLETLRHPIRTLQHIRSLGKKAGVAISPSTDISPIAYMLDELDLVCVMTVNPGFSGQRMIPSAIGKIAALRKMFDNAHRNIRIMADGHVQKETAPLMTTAGADVLVMGSSGLFNHAPEEYAKVISFYQNL